MTGRLSKRKDRWSGSDQYENGSPDAFSDTQVAWSVDEEEPSGTANERDRKYECERIPDRCGPLLGIGSVLVPASQAGCSNMPCQFFGVLEVCFKFLDYVVSRLLEPIASFCPVIFEFLCFRRVFGAFSRGWSVVSP